MALSDQEGKRVPVEAVLRNIETSQTKEKIGLIQELAELVRRIQALAQKQRVETRTELKLLLGINVDEAENDQAAIPAFELLSAILLAHLKGRSIQQLLKEFPEVNSVKTLLPGDDAVSISGVLAAPEGQPMIPSGVSQDVMTLWGLLTNDDVPLTPLLAISSPQPVPLKPIDVVDQDKKKAEESTEDMHLSEQRISQIIFTLPHENLKDRTVTNRILVSKSQLARFLQMKKPDPMGSKARNDIKTTGEGMGVTFYRPTQVDVAEGKYGTVERFITLDDARAILTKIAKKSINWFKSGDEIEAILNEVQTT